MSGFDLSLLLPRFVAIGVADASDDGDLELRPEEEPLLSARTVPRRRRQFALGRTAAHRALAELGVKAEAILRGEHREPLWPEDTVGSITHSDDTAIAAVARRTDCGGIGLDLERRDRYFPRLTELVAFGEERRHLEALDDAGRATQTLELFSAKESIYKAFFPRIGRFFGFGAAHIEWPDRPATPGPYHELVGRLVGELDPAYPPRRGFPMRVQWRGDVVLTCLALPADDAA